MLNRDNLIYRPPLNAMFRPATTCPYSRAADGWYVCFACAEVPIHPLPHTVQVTGIALGLESTATGSERRLTTPSRSERSACSRRGEHGRRVHRLSRECDLPQCCIGTTFPIQCSRGRVQASERWAARQVEGRSWRSVPDNMTAGNCDARYCRCFWMRQAR